MAGGRELSLYICKRGTIRAETECCSEFFFSLSELFQLDWNNLCGEIHVATPKQDPQQVHQQQNKGKSGSGCELLLKGRNLGLHGGLSHIIRCGILDSLAWVALHENLGGSGDPNIHNF
jgi:hypothetical protein